MNRLRRENPLTKNPLADQHCARTPNFTQTHTHNIQCQSHNKQPCEDGVWSPPLHSWWHWGGKRWSDLVQGHAKTKLCKVYLTPNLKLLPITLLAGEHKREVSPWPSPSHLPAFTHTVPCFSHTFPPPLSKHHPAQGLPLPGSLPWRPTAKPPMPPPTWLSGCSVSHRHFRLWCHEAQTQTLAHFITSPG